MQKNRINMNEWMELHPYDKTEFTDNYYLKIANELADSWDKCNIQFKIHEKVKNRICLYVTAYFEDIISDFGLWNTFVTKHKDFYDKWLPFYDVQSAEYLTDDINLADVKFILWYSIQELAGKPLHNILPPTFGPLQTVAEELYKVLDREFEKAPINERLTKLMKKDTIYKSLPLLKQYLNWLFAHSYLMEPSTNEKIMETQNFVQKKFEKNTPEQKNMIMYGIMQDVILSYPCGPLALHMNEWLCALAGKEHPEYENIRQLKVKQTCNCVVEHVTDESITLSNIMKEDSFDINKASFKKLPELVPGKTVITAGYVWYGGRWNLNGIAAFNDIANYANVHKQPHRDLSKIHAAVYAKFLQVNGNSPIAYFRSFDEMNDFLVKKMEWPDNNKTFDAIKDKRNYILFVSEDKGLLIAVDIAECVKDNNNPMYDHQVAEKKAFLLFVNKGQCPIELLEYLEEEGKLPDACLFDETKNMEKGCKLVHENWDFIARMFLNEFYWANTNQ